MTKAVMTCLVLCAAVAVLYDGGSTTGGAQAQTVASVQDGDTFTFTTGERVRINALNCPEMGQRGGAAAKAGLRRVLSGAHVQCTRINTDRYGRTIARCYADGADVAATLISAGLCGPCPRYDRGNRYTRIPSTYSGPVPRYCL